MSNLGIKLAPSFKKIAKNASIKAFVEGITAVVLGALVGAVFIISTRSIVEIWTSIIAFLSIIALIYVKKLKEPHIIAVSAVLGVILKLIL